MATLETLNVKITADVSELTDALTFAALATKNTEKKLKQKEVKTSKVDGTFNALDKILNLGKDETLAQSITDKVFKSPGSLSDSDKELLNSIDGIKSLLEGELKSILNELETKLNAAKVSEDEIKARLKFVEDAGKERIDNLIEDFSDDIEEAVTALSTAVSTAFAEMAIKGEFSAKKIGEAFLKTALDIISRELIQKPLESILGSVFKIFGLASGGTVGAGVPTLINEQGQEIFIPNTPGRIVNAPDTGRMLSGGGGVVVNQTLKFDTAIKNDMMATIFQASPLLIEHTKQAVIQSLQGRRF